MGTEIFLQPSLLLQDSVEKMGPLRGDGNGLLVLLDILLQFCREDGSPSRGRKLAVYSNNKFHFYVEKMGPPRGDGNRRNVSLPFGVTYVEKMGPLRGDGNLQNTSFSLFIDTSREDGSPLRGRKSYTAPLVRYLSRM